MTDEKFKIVLEKDGATVDAGGNANGLTKQAAEAGAAARNRRAEQMEIAARYRVEPMEPKG